jgi:hypothetical protein
MEHISTHTALSSDHLLVSKLSLMYVVKFRAILSLNIRMLTGVDFARVWTPIWILAFHWIVLNVKLKFILWSKISLKRSWSLSVSLVRPNRYCLTLLTPELRLRISRKNALRRIAQSTKNAGQIREFEIHNRLVRDICVELGNRAFDGKLRSLRLGHKSFWNFTKIVKNNVVTLITELEKVSAITEKFSRAHENTVQSLMGAVFV